MSIRVTFWGTRGSIPTPGPTTVRYGGNTSSVEVRHDGANEEHVVILDAGTGIRALGVKLAANGAPLDADLLVSHTHWDHIQGLPFFSPFFNRGNAVRIWGAKQGDTDLKEILRNQMNPVVFPVPLEGVAAELVVSHIEPGEFELDGFLIRCMRVRHPGTTLAFRLSPLAGGASLAYVPDNELGPGGTYDVAESWRADFINFLRGADVLIHDAMYTPEEITRYAGWGHSSSAEAVKLAADAEVKQLVLFHHRPEHNDEMIDVMLDGARSLAKSATNGSLDVVAAYEGLVLTL